jgi:hypothetical protein
MLTGRVGGSLKIVAGADIPMGSQINIAYSGGKPRSDRFLQDYGFLDVEGCSEEVTTTTIYGKLVQLF